MHIFRLLYHMLTIILHPNAYYAQNVLARLFVRTFEPALQCYQLKQRLAYFR